MGLKMMQRVWTISDTLTPVKILVSEKELYSLFTEQLSSVSQLIGSKKLGSISVVSENAEEGYAASAVNSEITVLLLVKVCLRLEGF